jgi:regulator of PEP synthase PpsR (kinase-PPPase family)
MALHDKLKVIIISDGTGETATSITRAAMTQFSPTERSFLRAIKTSEQKIRLMLSFKKLQFIMI